MYPWAQSLTHLAEAVRGTGQESTEHVMAGLKLLEALTADIEHVHVHRQ